MSLNLHLARIFHTVATEGGFSRAAEMLCISQSAVSKGVKELEAQLGLALIDRAGRGAGRAGVSLTEAGQALYEHLKEIFALEHAALEDIRARTGLKQGTLVIGASTTVAGYWLPPLLAAFRARHPEIGVNVVVGNTHFISEGLLDCRVDLAVVEGAVEEDGIIAEVWREEALAVVSAVDWDTQADTGRPSLKHLAAQTWLVREAGSGTGEAGQRLLRACGIAPAQTLEIGSNEGIARAVAQGLGLALLPVCLVQDLIDLKRLAWVQMPVELSRPLYRLRRAKRPLTPAAQAFVSLLDA